MQLKPEQLPQHLSQGIAPCYLIAGDETLIVQECADAIRIAAREAGCSEREIIEINNPSDWQNLLQSGGALSLFAERKLIEVRLPSGKPGAEGSKALQAFLEMASEDTLLIVSGKIDRQSQRAKWYTALDNGGVVITVWPIQPRELPNWIQRRLQAVGLQADKAAAQLLADRTEGNLLAAAQEVEKLKLLATDGVVTVETVLEGVLDNARYSAFSLADAALSGDSRNAIRTLRGLRAEATQPPSVLWALARDINLLADVEEDVRAGSQVGRALQERGVWRSRLALVQAAVERHNRRSIGQLQALAYRTDAVIKGQEKGDPWIGLDRIVLLLARGNQSGKALRARR